jgi:hypothetical protein
MDIFPNKFKINKVEKYIYMKNTDISYIIVYLYIDEMLILGNNDHMIKYIKKMLTNKFYMKYLGVIDIIQEIKIIRIFDR